MAFKILASIVALAALVVLYFFLIGLADGNVSSRNIAVWITLLLIVAAVMFGSAWLNSHQHPRLALTVLCILAIPALLYVLFIISALLSGNNWN